MAGERWLAAEISPGPAVPYESHVKLYLHGFAQSFFVSAPRFGEKLLNSQSSALSKINDEGFRVLLMCLLLFVLTQ